MLIRFKLHGEALFQLLLRQSAAMVEEVLVFLDVFEKNDDFMHLALPVVLPQLVVSKQAGKLSSAACRVCVCTG